MSSGVPSPAIGGTPDRSLRTSSDSARTAPTPVAVAVALLGVVLAACGSGVEPRHRFPVDATVVEVEVSAVPLAGGSCTDRFVRHELPHVTEGPGAGASTFDGTGAGVALGDLDGDDDLDIVLANLSDATSILFNEGALRWRREPLMVGRFRQAAAVDVDGDGDLDIVLSTGAGPPVRFDNDGSGTFERERLEGVEAATYAMAWGDLGGDGDLDLVTGSYNAELSIMRNSPVLGSDTGVVLHERDGEGWVVTRLAVAAQALAIDLVDLDLDHDTDIVVGNDLSTPDQVWFDNDGGWLPAMPFTTTSFSTMSLDAGDVDNDGDFDVFSTDMKPRADDPDAEFRYAEVTADMEAMPVIDQIQQPENVLGLAGPNGFDNAAPGLGVDATGWSWAGLFGDLDADGRLDLYVATGMRSDNLFAALPEATLVEPNQVFANTGSSMERRPGWGLDDTAGARGLAMGDLDADGDLDIVANNLGSPSVVFENRLCGGADLLVDLRWPSSANPFAVGAVVEVADGGQRFTRSVDATSGYLSGGPPQVHVGLGAPEGPLDVAVLWPDGARSDVAGVDPNQRLVLTRR